MNIIVCIKQVPDTTEVKIDPKTNRLIREGVPTIMNHDDKTALEVALQLKEKNNAKVTVLTMGPPQAEEVLTEAMAMGADEAYLLCDRAFAGSDTWATANALAAAIKTIEYDLLLFGRQAIDGDTAQVGPQTAENLKLPQITYAQKIEIDGNKVKVERELEDGYEIVESTIPCLITIIKEAAEPRYSTLNGIDKAFEKEIKKITAKDINIDEKKVGLLASPTRVKKIFSPSAKGQGTILQGSSKDIAQELIKTLKEKEIIQKFD